MVPMRDGVRVNTEVYVPKGAKEPLPIVLTRTRPVHRRSSQMAEGRLEGVPSLSPMSPATL